MLAQQASEAIAALNGDAFASNALPLSRQLEPLADTSVLLEYIKLPSVQAGRIVAFTNAMLSHPNVDINPDCSVMSAITRKLVTVGRRDVAMTVFHAAIAAHDACGVEVTAEMFEAAIDAAHDDIGSIACIASAADHCAVGLSIGMVCQLMRLYGRAGRVDVVSVLANRTASRCFDHECDAIALPAGASDVCLLPGGDAHRVRIHGRVAAVPSGIRCHIAHGGHTESATVR